MLTKWGLVDAEHSLRISERILSVPVNFLFLSCLMDIAIVLGLKKLVFENWELFKDTYLYSRFRYFARFVPYIKMT